MHKFHLVVGVKEQGHDGEEDDNKNSNANNNHDANFI